MDRAVQKLGLLLCRAMVVFAIIEWFCFPGYYKVTLLTGCGFGSANNFFFGVFIRRVQSVFFFQHIHFRYVYVFYFSIVVLLSFCGILGSGLIAP